MTSATTPIACIARTSRSKLRQYETLNRVRSNEPAVAGQAVPTHAHALALILYIGHDAIYRPAPTHAHALALAATEPRRTS